MLQKNKWLLIGAAAVIFLGFLALRSCGTTDEISRLKGMLAATQRQADVDRKALEASDAEWNKALQEKNTQIEKLKADSTKQGMISADLNQNIKKKDAAIAQLEKDLEGLKDPAAIIAKQAEEITTLKENLSLEREDKAAIAKDRDNWKAIATTYEGNAKYYQGEAGKWKVQDDKDRRALEISNAIVGKQDHRISWLQLKGTLETVAIVGAAGYIAYTILKPAKTASAGAKTLSLSIRF